MKKLILFLLLCCLPGQAEPFDNADKNNEYLAALKSSSNFNSDAQIAFLRKTTHFKIPDSCWSLMLEPAGYGGVKRSMVFATEMLKYFEANGHPNLRKMAETGMMDQVNSELDQIAKNYQFTLVYEGPANKDVWKNFSNYWGQLDSELFHWGWAPKSGTALMTVVVTPKANGFSAKSDGKNFTITNPVLEVPTSGWEKNVRPVLERDGVKVNRT